MKEMKSKLIGAFEGNGNPESQEWVDAFVKQAKVKLAKARKLTEEAEALELERIVKLKEEELSKAVAAKNATVK